MCKNELFHRVAHGVPPAHRRPRQNEERMAIQRRRHVYARARGAGSLKGRGGCGYGTGAWRPRDHTVWTDRGSRSAFRPVREVGNKAS